MAQNMPNYTKVEAESIDLYNSAKWKGLIRLSENSINLGLDYYLLRYRTGIAYLNLQNYRKAAIHFENAYWFNPGEEKLLENMYYSYLWAGRDYDAKVLRKKLPDEMKERLKIKNGKFVESISLESGLGLSNDPTANQISLDQKNKNNWKHIFAQYDLTGNTHYVSLGFKHNIFSWLSFNHSFLYMTIDKTRQILFYDSINSYNKNDNYKLKQTEYYVNSDIVLNKGLVLTPAFHYINVVSNTITYSSYTLNNQVPLDIMPVYGKADTKFSNYVYSLAISKDIKKTRLSLYGVYAGLNYLEQYEAGLSLCYFPLGNLNYFISTSLTSHLQKKVLRVVVEEKVGMKLFSRLWFDAFITYGDMLNYVEANASLVYNMADIMKYKTGISLTFSISSNIEFSFHYQYVNLLSKFLYYENAVPIKTQINNYHNNLLIGGLKWKL
ncbi:MAG: hypothetical protein Q8880_07960 [Bacteroidota bacterium]|nr:hypothetical protein [Bacteroidota bacterium]